MFSTQVTPAGQSFIKRFRGQSPTISPTGICSSATDDDGKFTLWSRNVSGKIICSGLNYASIPQDGSTMDTLTAYVYDATMFLLQVGGQLYLMMINFLFTHCMHAFQRLIVRTVILSIHPINTPYQYILSIHPINTL